MSFHSLSLLGTTSIPCFCILRGSSEESSSGNAAVQESVPSVMHGPSQFRVWRNFQPDYPKDPQVQSSGSFSTGTHMEIMDCARTSSVYKCKWFEVSSISVRMPRGKTLSVLLMGWAQLSATKNLKNLKNLQNLAAAMCMVIPVLIHESCSDHCSEVVLSETKYKYREVSTTAAKDTAKMYSIYSHTDKRHNSTEYFNKKYSCFN